VVILVDDDPAVRRALVRLLRAAGHLVEAHASAEEYLARAPAEPHACLLLDMRMPGGSGLDLLRAIAGTPLSLPTIFITGHGTADDRRQALALGAIDVLNKPLDESVLLAAIARALASRTRS
jgi:FixJ family two-component response regulator